MPDPVTNTEIEDVLTSIRRLVSENRTVAATHPAPQIQIAKDEDTQADWADDAPADAQEDVAPALVLTPALRVLETENSEELDAEDESFAASEPLAEDDAPFDGIDEPEGEVDSRDDRSQSEDAEAEDTFDEYDVEADDPVEEERTSRLNLRLPLRRTRTKLRKLWRMNQSMISLQMTMRWKTTMEKVSR